MALELDRALPVLGSTFIERMNGKRFAILKIGNEHFTRHQLVTEVGCGNFVAARNLQKIVTEQGLNTVRDLYHISPYELAGTHGVGTTTLFVLMSIFEAKGLDVNKWMGRDPVTFTTLKHRVLKREAEGAKNEKKAIARRKRRTHEAQVRQVLRNPNARLVKRPATPPPSPPSEG